MNDMGVKYSRTERKSEKRKMQRNSKKEKKWLEWTHDLAVTVQCPYQGSYQAKTNYVFIFTPSTLDKTIVDWIKRLQLLIQGQHKKQDNFTHPRVYIKTMKKAGKYARPI